MSKGAIIYVGGFELPDRNAAAHRVVANAKLLRMQGYEVVLVGVSKSLRVDQGLSRSAVDHFGFECWSVPYPVGTLSWLKYILGHAEVLRFLFRQRHSRIAAVICYNFPAVAQLRITARCRKLGVKSIADSTEWYDASGGSAVYRIIKWFDTTVRMRFANLRCDGLITTSKFLTSFYGHRGKLTVELPTLFDTIDFPAPPEASSGALISFIYVGTPFDSHKVNRNRSNLKERLDLAISLFWELRKAGKLFRFDIYGISEEEYLRVFPEHRSMLANMADCVTFYGYQSNAVIRVRLAESSFSIFFRDETRVTLAGFPTKLAESISCGTPVICNRMRSLEDYSRLGSLFLSEKGGERALLERLLNLSVREVSEMKSNAYRAKAFDFRRYEARLAEFFQRIGN